MLLNYQVRRQQRGSAFLKTLVYTKETQINYEPFTEEERNQLSELFKSEHAMKNQELA